MALACALSMAASHLCLPSCLLFAAFRKQELQRSSEIRATMKAGMQSVVELQSASSLPIARSYSAAEEDVSPRRLRLSTEVIPALLV